MLNPRCDTTYETPAQLATAIGRGDRQAEAALYERYYRQTLFVLERKTGDPELAQDLCQEAFCITIERLRSQPLADPDKLSAFLHSTALNLYIGELRKADRRKTFNDQALLDSVADATQNQYRALLRERSGEAVRRLIEALDNSRDRALLYQFYIEEKDKTQVCADLGLSHRHFDKVLFRAKQRFKELLMHS
ncbi:MAG: sigma-70 family RNA polymerase sigma factor [Pseudomonadota bacterium]|nr:sigma-70 family RNA polymerase sigma factor [Pseudomonadota bacterium]